MITVTAPDSLQNEPFKFRIKVFLAGGISGCPDWQSMLIEMLDDLSDTVVLYNPRRANVTLGNTDIGKEQIQWEKYAMDECDLISFWFAEETTQPIVFFELGARIGYLNNPDYVVCAHHKYLRRFDVVEQLSHYRPDVYVGRTLEELAGSIRQWVEKRLKR